MNATNEIAASTWAGLPCKVIGGLCGATRCWWDTQPRWYWVVAVSAHQTRSHHYAKSLTEKGVMGITGNRLSTWPYHAHPSNVFDGLPTRSHFRVMATFSSMRIRGRWRRRVLSAVRFVVPTILLQATELAAWLLKANASINAEFLGLNLSKSHEDDVDVTDRQPSRCSKPLPGRDCSPEVALIVRETESEEHPTHDAIWLQHRQADVGKEMVDSNPAEVRKTSLQIGAQAKQVLRGIAWAKRLDVLTNRTERRDKAAELLRIPHNTTNLTRMTNHLRISQDMLDMSGFVRRHRPPIREVTTDFRQLRRDGRSTKPRVEHNCGQNLEKLIIRQTPVLEGLKTI
jgi:hypothetical protein